MTNPFKSFISRKTMGHAAFEKTMCAFEEIRKDSVHSGNKPIGHLRRGNGAVLPEVGACGKGGRRVNTEAIKDLIRYLEREGQRFDPIQVGNALTALKAVKGGKALDLTFLAERFHGLIDTTVLTTDFRAVRGQICTETNEVYAGACRLVGESSRRVSFEPSPTAKAEEQARREDAISLGRRFSEACLSGPQQKHPEDAKRLFRWLGGEFGGSDLTRPIGVNAIPGLVEEYERKLMDQKAALEQLLAQAGSRGDDPAYHKKVTELSDRFMASQAVHIQTLAFVANVLGYLRNPIDLPPDFRLPTAGFAQSLVNLAKALQAPGSDFMDDNKWAAKTKAAAEKRWAELSAPKESVAAPEGHGQQVNRLKAEALEAYSDFLSECLHPKDGAPSLSDEQARLRDAITRELRANPGTEKLSLAAVKSNLFGFLPDRIQQLHADLNTTISAWKRSGGNDSLLLTRIRDFARELDEQIEGYLTQLEAVGSILVTDPQLGKPTPELDAARLAAGNRMLQLNVLQKDANGELMSIQAFARQARDRAQRELNDLSMTPASKVRGAPPRPLDSEPAHMDEVHFDQQVDGELAKLLALDSVSAQGQGPEADRLLTKPIRTARQVSAEVAQPLEGAQPKRNFRQDWELGHARLHVAKAIAKPNPRWSDELENTLSGLDEVVKRFDQAGEGRLPAFPVQRSRGLVRQNAVANLTRPRSSDEGVKRSDMVSASQRAERSSVDVSDSKHGATESSETAAKAALDSLLGGLGSNPGSAASNTEKALWKALDAKGIDPDYMGLTLVPQPPMVHDRLNLLKDLDEENPGAGNSQHRYERMRELGKDLQQDVDRYLSRLHVAGTVFNEFADRYSGDQPTLAGLFRDAATRLFQLERAQRDPQSPLMKDLNESLRLGQKAQEWLDRVKSASRVPAMRTTDTSASVGRRRGANRGFEQTKPRTFI